MDPKFNIKNLTLQHTKTGTAALSQPTFSTTITGSHLGYTKSLKNSIQLSVTYLNRLFQHKKTLQDTSKDAIILLIRN